MKRVLFAERRLPHYRVSLIEATREKLDARGVAFDFIHGDPSPAELARRDEGQLPWALRMRHSRYALADRLVWQPFDVDGYDLVIVGQENRLLFNHWLCRPWRPFDLAFFGHGMNFAARHANTLRERFKRFTTLQADWWFAYTALSKSIVEQAGFAPQRITVLNNATDTATLRAQLASVSSAEVEALQRARGLTPGKTGLFLGSLYADKGLRLLLDATASVQATDPSFSLVIVGDGPARNVAANAAATMRGVHWLGALQGRDKAIAMAASDFMLMPGSVGLSIVDGFAGSLPLLSTQSPGHGPEIAYLQPGRNGAITAPGSTEFAAAISRLLQSPAQLAQWRENAQDDGLALSVEAMAQRFADGIVDALSASHRRPR